ncbi:Serine/threonine-protein kinase SKY1 [Tolypocladium capitatum]|uniref:Serine/threonine-protein kinase SKY1 n=1 Tax=Tolypocladium capitatum TaxID=45235 RepID=A0A2K3QCF1_9HYPO|nr:Serine/threonine-protein kinase SKY1 [Tolypocladium capitatum]
MRRRFDSLAMPAHTSRCASIRGLKILIARESKAGRRELLMVPPQGPFHPQRAWRTHLPSTRPVLPYWPERNTPLYRVSCHGAYLRRRRQDGTPPFTTLPGISFATRPRHLSRSWACSMALIEVYEILGEPERVEVPLRCASGGRIDVYGKSRYLEYPVHPDDIETSYILKHTCITDCGQSFETNIETLRLTGIPGPYCLIAPPTDL